MISSPSHTPQQDAAARRVFAILAALAVLYALLAALRSVSDPDLGWNLATARYVLAHRTIPSTDVLSYTAAGVEWIYPPLAGLLFLALFRLGGYALLSWFSAAACAGTVALLLLAARRRISVAALAIVAVPVIAARSVPRANLFTVVLFAACWTVLWRHYLGRRPPLWLLPVFMIAWVNLHLGFIAGLVLMAAYVLLEAGDIAFGPRAAAVRRLRDAGWWLASAAVATLINPWGPQIYSAIARQNRLLEPTGPFIGEWTRVHFNLGSLYAAALWRAPDSAYWWLLLAAAAGAAAAVRHKHYAWAVLLACATALSVLRVRFEALFAVVVVVVAGAAISEALATFVPRLSLRHRRAALALIALLLAVLTAVRAADLVTDRYYLSTSDVALFGPGVSWWYPEGAADFIAREHLPGHLFNHYSVGGYLEWRLPGELMYMDGRSIPFGKDVFFRYMRLLTVPPDSPEWEREAHERNINTLVFSNTRFPVLGSAALAQFCGSRLWRPVYLDTVSAVFVRNTAENQPWIRRLELDCAKIEFVPPGSARPPLLYNFYANAGAALASLGRRDEAMEAWRRAALIFAGDPYLHLLRGSLWQQMNQPVRAESEYRAALREREFDEPWAALGQALAQQGRFDDALAALHRALEFSGAPSEVYAMIAQVELAEQQPREALQAIDRAIASSPYKGAAAGAGAVFRARMNTMRAQVWMSQGDLDRAIECQQRAVNEAPEQPDSWRKLAELYQRQGRDEVAAAARQQADRLAGRGGPEPGLP